MSFDLLLENATVATMREDGGPYGLITDASVGVTADTISYVGPADPQLSAATVRDVAGMLITPALIDCHTHVVFGGTRVHDFEERLGGASYADLAARGGGILSTVRATRAASGPQLVADAATRLQWMLQSGVGTVEIKSGYGLTAADEVRMLAVARQLGSQGPQRVVTSLLAAHAVPPEFAGNPDGYITHICNEILPAAQSAGVVDFVDAFAESIAFDNDQVRRVFTAAEALGIPVRLHADQLSDGEGAALAAEFGALSADHLEHASAAGLEAMAAAGTVAVVIPGASVFLDEATRPDIHAMRELGVRIAVSTDLNPGTSPVASLQAAMWLATSRFRLTPEEALVGTTRNAAVALGLSDTGIIEVGRRADLAEWSTNDPAALSYWMGAPLCTRVWIGGTLAHERKTHD